MTNTGPEKHQPHNEEDLRLRVVLLHGRSGQSEDWSQVVEQLTSRRPVIRLNYTEPVTGTNSAADPVDGYVIFNIRQNRYRLVTVVHYSKTTDEKMKSRPKGTSTSDLF